MNIRPHDRFSAEVTLTPEAVLSTCAVVFAAKTAARRSAPRVEYS